MWQLAVVLVASLGMACAGGKPARQASDRAEEGAIGPGGPSCEEVYAAYLAEHPAEQPEPPRPQDREQPSQATEPGQPQQALPPPQPTQPGQAEQPDQPEQPEQPRYDAPTLSTEAYGAVLSHGSYFVHCDAPESLDISICAAVQHGSARGVTVETNPSRLRLSACIDRAVRRLRFLPSKRMALTRTFFAAEGTPPWGNPRRAPADEAKVAAFLHSLPAGVDRARALCAKVLVAMPGFWKELLAADPSLEKRGTPGATISMAGGPSAEQGLRIFDDGPDLEALLASPAFTSFTRRFSAGRIRPANAAERELTYRLQMVAFTADTPITVVELGPVRVAFLLSEGRVYWIERLSDWQTDVGKAPIGSKALDPRRP